MTRSDPCHHQNDAWSEFQEEAQRGHLRKLEVFEPFRRHRTGIYKVIRHVACRPLNCVDGDRSCRDSPYSNQPAKILPKRENTR